MVAGYVAEVFRSFQGEGPFVGIPQVFLRMAGCSLRCSYCDTAWARERVPECVLRGVGPEERLANPIETDELVSSIRLFVEAAPRVHSLSITGGEPLEQGEFLCAFLRQFRSSAVPVYLETNGLVKHAAAEVAPLVDIVSLDIKLPSLCGGEDFFDIYRDVLPFFRQRDLFCKIAIAEGFEMDEFIEAVRLIASFDRATLLVIQPATASASCRAVSPDTLFECYCNAALVLDDVRVIPQCHRLMGIP
jgi:organic radical activating enzyme